MKYILPVFMVCISTATFAQIQPQPKSAMEYIKQQEAVDANLTKPEKQNITLKHKTAPKPNHCCTTKKKKISKSRQQ